MATKMNLLEIVQKTLSGALDGDTVNSITDTQESLQVAELAIFVYNERFANRGYVVQKSPVKIEGLGDTTRPTYLRLPDNCESIDWLKYRGRDVTFVEPELFLSLLFQESSKPGTQLINDTDLGAYFYVKTDANPCHYTSFDNKHIICDAFDSDVEDTLHGNQTLCWGTLSPVFQMSDTAYPPLMTPDDYPGYLAEVMSVCAAELRQNASQKFEQISRRQRVREINNLWRTGQNKDKRYTSTTGNYGRPRP